VTRKGLAEATGTNIETIRYYENIELMPDPRRGENGYRLYGEIARQRLKFILRGRELGFRIEELKSLLSLVDEGTYSCGQIHALTVRHLESIRTKIRDLSRLEKTLSEVSTRCEGGEVPECPIIETLFSENETGLA
jgi:MerR family mercuric resistance operon transcriptional regulator